jgi:hypothetical protein
MVTSRELDRTIPLQGSHDSHAAAIHDGAIHDKGSVDAFRRALQQWVTAISSPPMHHESRTERQEHQRQNGYKAIGLSLSQTCQSNYQSCVLHKPSPS